MIIEGHNAHFAANALSFLKGSKRVNEGRHLV